MRKVYILLSKTKTFPSKVIHKLTKASFTHTSIALTPKTDSFYSYARRSLNNPFNAGFILENTKTFVFAKYADCNCALFSLEVSDEAYEKISNHINDIILNYKKAKYNFLGLFLTGLGIRVKKKYKFTCSQFVAIILQNSDEIKLPNDPYLMRPIDFLKIENMEKIYEGTLKDCNFDALAYSADNIPTL